MIRCSEVTVHFHDYDQPYTVEVNDRETLHWIEVRDRYWNQRFTMFFDCGAAAHTVGVALRIALGIELAAGDAANSGAGDTSDAGPANTEVR